MPTYEYQCTACHRGVEVFQKMSDPPATDCPKCGESALVKQLSASGFQLTGTGWYATDFKNSGTSTKPAEASPEAPAAAPAECGAGACGACE